MKNSQLTDEEILILGEDVFYEIITLNEETGVFDLPQFSIALARVVEQAHGIGERH